MSAINDFGDGVGYTNIVWSFEIVSKNLPIGLTIHNNLVLLYGVEVYLPDGLAINGNLDLSEATISYLPNGLIVRKDVVMDGVRGDNYGALQLPDNMVVGGVLYLNYASITAIPRNLSVGRDLVLMRANSTSEPQPWLPIPQCLDVGGQIVW